MKKYRIRKNSFIDWMITAGLLFAIMLMAGLGTHFIDGIY